MKVKPRKLTPSMEIERLPEKRWCSFVYKLTMETVPGYVFCAGTIKKLWQVLIDQNSSIKPKKAPVWAQFRMGYHTITIEHTKRDTLVKLAEVLSVLIEKEQFLDAWPVGSKERSRWMARTTHVCNGLNAKGIEIVWGTVSLDAYFSILEQEALERQMFPSHGLKRNKYDAVYGKLFAEQDGRCAICDRRIGDPLGRGGSIIRLVVDHSHATGNIRALLCQQCNSHVGNVECGGVTKVRGIGLPIPDYVSKIQDYLERFSKAAETWIEE